MIIKYQISPYPGLVNEDLVVKIWEANNDTPGGIVYTVTFPEKNGAGVPTPGAGHQVINTVNQSGFDNVVHIIRLFTSVGGIMLHEYTMPPTTNLAVVFDPVRFKIGDGGPLTPAANSDTYTDPILFGLDKKEYLVRLNNYGTLFPDVHYTHTPDNGSGAGAFQLVAPIVFDDESEWTIEKRPSVLTTVVNDSVTTKLFGQTPASADIYFNIVANVSYAAAHVRKLLRFQGAFTYEFILTPPVGYGFSFINRSGATGKVKFTNAPLIWPGGDIAEIDIQNFSEACFVFDGTKWNCVYINSSSFLVPGTIPAGTILGTGRFNVGDVPPGDPAWAIVHNLNIVGDYNVFISIMSTSASYTRDNKIGIAWWHDTVGNKANSFNVTLQELAGEVQDIKIVWLIIKA